MSVAQVEQCIRKNHDGQHVLDALPSHDSLEWTRLEAYPQAYAPMGLVLATDDMGDIVAFFTQLGDKVPQVRYCSKPSGEFWSADSVIPISQDDLNRLELRPPFKYNAGTAKTEKRKFNYIVKWYFMTKGLLDSPIAGSIDGWCKVFYRALQAVESQMPREDGRLTRSEARREYDAVRESSEATPSHHERQLLEKRGGSTLSDCDTLCDFLAQENHTHLLTNIGEWKKLNWDVGRITSDSLPYKLLVGKTRQDKAEIYAHLKAVNNTYTVQYWYKSRHDKASGVTLPSIDLAAQDVDHPFDKTYDKTCNSPSKSDEERIEILVKWYFVASGKINNLLEYEPNFPARFLDTLNYIANRMPLKAQSLTISKFKPGVSSRPFSSSPICNSSVPPNDLLSPRESPNIVSKFTLPDFPALAVQNGCLTPPRHGESQTAQERCTTTPQTPRQVVPRAKPRASRTPQRAQPLPATRGTKRTADDASLISVTAELNKLDEQLEFHEFEKDDFLEQETLDKQNLEAKQSEQEKRFIEDMESRLKQFKEDQDAEARKWVEEQRASSQKFMDDWQRRHDELIKVRTQAAERRTRMCREKYKRLRGVGYKNE